MTEQFGEANVRYGASPRRPDPPDFPVRERDGHSFSSLSLSDVLRTLPASRDEYVFVAPEIRDEARTWIDNERGRIIEAAFAKDTETMIRADHNARSSLRVPCSDAFGAVEE